MYEDEEKIVKGLKSKMEKLEKKVKNMKVRKEEFEKFPEYIEKLTALVEGARGELKKINETRTWIPQEEILNATSVINHLSTLIESKITERKKEPKTCDPILTEDKVEEQNQIIAEVFDNLRRIPKNNTS